MRNLRIIQKIIIVIKVAPTVEAVMAGFPKKDHQIDTIPGTSERLALNILIEAIT